MTKKWSIGLIMLFVFAISITFGFYSTGYTLSGPPGPPIPCTPYTCCVTADGGSGVWIYNAAARQCWCSCMGGGVEGGYNPYNCPLNCSLPH